MNPYMYIYALSVAILHRPDCKEIPLPAFAEVLPDKFMDKSVFVRLREEANLVDEGSRVPFEISKDYSASDLDEEHRVAYFREDIGVNLHHWHWHLVYPTDSPSNIVNKDRRGELFYYMHQQILARYNVERLCNKLMRTRKFNNLREPMPEAYFSKLDNVNSSKTWPARFKNATLSDVNRDNDGLRFELADLDRWRDRILEAIHTGSVSTPRGERIPLTEEKGIDILGNLMESSNLSINRKLYGELHNFGHVAISFCHDPDNRYLVNN
ncbi:phenoloxidase 1-like [Diaphorina citri]|uniref:Phenoloxidase 1-like n=1 Tax=Diaphorina citri TaxID=121845 RepID=A0A3Q0ISK4_DIACI|nr:phenoloxidase 1-like [Diaphorina citri]